MSVVSNASPLINLVRIGQLDLLAQLYGELVVPEAVWHEVVLEGGGQPGAKEVETASWVEVRSVANHELVRALQQELDAGEAEAIAGIGDRGGVCVDGRASGTRDGSTYGRSMCGADWRPNRSQAQGIDQRDSVINGCITRHCRLLGKRRSLQARVAR